MKRHGKSIHEKKQLFKCDICAYTTAPLEKGDMNARVKSDHEKKKPFKCL